MKKLLILAVLLTGCKTMGFGAAEGMAACNEFCKANPQVKSTSEAITFLGYSSYDCECK